MKKKSKVDKNNPTKNKVENEFGKNIRITKLRIITHKNRTANGNILFPPPGDLISESFYNLKD